MNEDFLHFLWKNGLYKTPLSNCYTNELVEVILPGQHNFDQGPDFFNARIKIGSTIWAGNVEIHQRSSDWKRHKHHLDKAYGNIILHVVGKNDEKIIGSNGELIPVVELDCLPELYNRYMFLMQTQKWLPCQSFIADVNPFVMEMWYESLAIERISDKIDTIVSSLKFTKNNWEESFYYIVAQAFGLKANAQPFFMLAQSLPLNVLAHHKNSLVQVEALLFGQAGLLPSQPSDDYTTLLNREYLHLKQKYSLQPIETHLWKFARMRPASLPTIRIAQFAMLIHKTSGLLSKIVDCKSIGDIKKFFDLGVSEYWLTHYIFGKETINKRKNIGQLALSTIIINAFVPFIFHYGKSVGKSQLADTAIEWLEQLPGEVNQILAQWQTFGVEAKSALESQALIQLTNCYCQKRRCLYCRVGRQVLSPIFKTN